MVDKPKDTETYARSALKQGYIRRLLDQADMSINVASGGPMDDTISSRLLRWKLGTVPKPYWWKKSIGWFGCGALGFIQKWHDTKALAGDIGRARSEIKRNEETLVKGGSNPPERVE
jgi:hypothetical protein